MQKLIRKARKLIRREDGQAIAEYALILALVALVATAALTLLGLAISSSVQNLVDSWP
ncbi:MAG: Flp family type IVb pilin [Dehalococcoidia bacterium]|nr:Flp family type IVb pilin [Dehalococcoidia bacterium]